MKRLVLTEIARADLSSIRRYSIRTWGQEQTAKLPQCRGPRRHAAAFIRPYPRYSVGTTNMLSSVDVVNPQRMTIAIGV